MRRAPDGVSDVAANFAIPRPTCPKIDELCDRLTEIMKDSRMAMRDGHSAVKFAASSYDLFGDILAGLEDLRCDNANLRMGVFHYKELFEDVVGQKTGL